MLSVTYNDALQSKPAKYEQLCLTPDDNVYYVNKRNDRGHLHFKRSGFKKYLRINIFPLKVFVLSSFG